MAYFIHKQLLPKNNLIWVLKLHSEDAIEQFETIEEAKSKIGLLINEDSTGRIYKVVIKNEDGTFSDVS
jgi:uncharacterized protein YciU (UPF0263 family)